MGVLQCRFFRHSVHIWSPVDHSYYSRPLLNTYKNQQHKNYCEQHAPCTWTNACPIRCWLVKTTYSTVRNEVEISGISLAERLQDRRPACQPTASVHVRVYLWYFSYTTIMASHTHPFKMRVRLHMIIKIFTFLCSCSVFTNKHKVSWTLWHEWQHNATKKCRKDIQQHKDWPQCLSSYMNAHTLTQ